MSAAAESMPQGRTRLVRRASGMEFPDFPDHFSQASFGLPFVQTGVKYYESMQPGGVADLSFAIVDDAGPLAIAGCDAGVPGKLTRFGSPLEIWWRDGLDPMARRRLTRDLIGELTRAIGAAGMESAWLRTNDRLDPDGALAGRLADMGAEWALALRAVMDLSWSDDALLDDMRKGHRQQVRWGRDHLAMETVDAQAPDRLRFDRYRALHAEVAGRVTRGDASWDAMFELIAAGEGDLLLASLNGELVGGTLILDGGGTAYYASGAYKREHFDKPLSHYPVYLAAQRARERGQRRFDVGESVGGGIDMSDEKQRSIGRFKSGFAGGADASILWSVPAPK